MYAGYNIPNMVVNKKLPTFKKTRIKTTMKARTTNYPYGTLTIFDNLSNGAT